MSLGQPHNRMTIRLNGGTAHVEEVEKREERFVSTQPAILPDKNKLSEARSKNNAPSGANTVRKHGKEESYQNNIWALEELIRSTNDQPDNPFWSEEKTKIASEPRKEKQAKVSSKKGGTAFGRRPSMLRVVLTVGAALLGGILVGYVLLSGLMQQWLPRAMQEEQSAIYQQQGSGADQGGGAATQGKENISGSNSASSDGDGGKLVLPSAGEPIVQHVALKGEATYYLLQSGVFTQKEGLDAAVQSLKKKGMPVAVDVQGKESRIYTGLTGKSKQADNLAGLLGLQEVYVKELTIKPPADVTFLLAEEEAQQYWQTTNSYVGLLTDIAYALSSGQKLEDQSAWKQVEEQWVRYSERMLEGLGGTADVSNTIDLQKALTAAGTALREYESSGDEKYLTSMQQALLDAVILQKDWARS